MDTIRDEIDKQKSLFQRELNRTELQSYNSRPGMRTVRIHVYRNHSFEPIASIIHPFAGFSGFQLVFSYSDYDDSLSFSDIPTDSDVVLVWVDLARYGRGVDTKSFLNERLRVLRGKSQADIMLFGTGARSLRQEDFDIVGCYVVDPDPLMRRLGDRFFDERLQRVTASRLSNEACLHIAQWLGLSLFPSLLRPILKAIVTDLDNTLYAGVLGEDGIGGIILTDGHRRLQEKLKLLKGQGFFLGIASKNELADVRSMFEMRTDFPLIWDDFSAVGISWEGKDRNIKAIAETLRIAPDSMLFIDDNIGEIIAVKSNIPEIGIVMADAENPSKTIDVLSMYPGLFKWRATDVDIKRAADIRSNEDREKMKIALPHEEYIRQLNLHVAYRINVMSDVERVAELGGKTNQFILSYKRYKEQEIAEIMRHDGRDIVDFSLKDDLSDSGLIGAVISELSGDRLIIEDLFVSCRALGRDIEDVMILRAIDILRKKYSPREIRINYTKGDRNRPAMNWLQKLVKRDLESSGSVALPEYVFDFKAEHVAFSVE